MASDLNEYVTVTISAATASPSVPSQSIPLVAAYVATSDVMPGRPAFDNRVREYASMLDVATDFQTYSAAYRGLAPLFSQSSAGDVVLLGRLASVPTNICTCTPVVANSRVYALDIVDSVGTAYTATYTGDGSDTAAEVVTGIKASIAAASPALVGITATGTDTLILTGTAGVHFTVAPNVVSFQRWTLAFTSTGTDMATDLVAIAQERDDFYAVTLATVGSTEILTAAAWCQTNSKLGMFSTADSACYNSASTTDVAYALKQLNNKYNHLVFARYASAQLPDTALAGYVLPRAPGSIVFRSANVQSVTADSLSSTERSALTAKRCGFVTAPGGVTVVNAGKVMSGEWADVVRDLDWATADMGQRVATSEMAADKSPFTDLGIATMEGVVRGAMQAAETAGVYAPGWTVTVPTAASISPANKAARILPNVRFSAVLAGSIFQTNVVGVVTQ